MLLIFGHLKSAFVKWVFNSFLFWKWLTFFFLIYLLKLVPYIFWIQAIVQDLYCKYHLLPCGLSFCSFNGIFSWTDILNVKPNVSNFPFMVFVDIPFTKSFLPQGHEDSLLFHLKAWLFYFYIKDYDHLKLIFLYI